MTHQFLHPHPCTSGQQATDALLPALQAALDATGPPLALLPASPADHNNRLLAAVRPDEPLEVDGVAAVVTTSGSTGEPKTVLLPAAALRASASATLDRLGGPGRWLLALPAQYIAGLQVVVRSLYGGTAPVALDLTTGFTAAGFAAATERLGTDARRYTALVPTQLTRLLDDPAGTDALRSYAVVLVGGAAASDRLLRSASEAGVHVVTTYGMSETCGGCVYDGLPLTGVTVDVRPDDRVRIAGPVLAAGYRLRPDLTAAAYETGDGQRWHVTPDVGRLHGDGRLEVLGRADDVAVSGGVNVPLAAVERALGSHPAVTAVTCLAVPDDEWGERVVAFVVPGNSRPSLDALRDHLGRTRPRSWAPRSLVVVDELPLLTSGKPDRRALVALLPRSS
ncbi:MAG: AMP-binding protein [Streptosporangiales bacterium]|nr:AMP-binding protein [Streptosporangiales bacterium]